MVERAITETVKLPILRNVLLKTDSNKLKVSTTNLELGIERVIPAKVIENGSIAVPFNIFYNVVNNSDSERINLEVKDGNLLFKTDNYEAKLQGTKAEEFPVIPKIENKEQYFEIDAKIFKCALSKVINAAQISEIRPEISGVLFDFQLTFLKLAATDSFRLAEKTLLERDFKTNFNRSFKVVIPLKSLQEVLRIFSDSKKLVIQVDSNQVLFKNDELELLSRLIDGNYPDYDQIIPKGFATEILISREHFINAVKLVSSFSGKINDIRLTAKDSAKNLEIYSANQYLGENRYLIPAKINGSGFESVAFNWRYLLDGLKVIDSESLFFGLNGDSKPAMIKSPQDDSYFYILMPIKI